MPQSLEYKRAYNRERAEWLKLQGYCVWCGKAKAESGKKLCADCAEKSAEHNAIRWKNMTTERKKQTYSTNNEQRKRLRTERRDQGLCTVCGRKLPNAEHFTCWECRRKAQKYTQKKRQASGAISKEMRYSGYYCCQCCKPIERTPSNLCAECYSKCVEKAANMRKSPKWRANIESGCWRMQNDILFEVKNK